MLLCGFSGRLIFCCDEGVDGCFFDDGSDLVGMRDENEVATGYLGDFAACSLAHEMFEGGLDGMVFRSDDIPSGFGAPGGFTEDVAKGG